MSKLRPNRKSGLGRYVKHGILGKQKTYRNTEFERLPELTEEEKRESLIDQLKPYSYTPSKYRAVKAAGPVDLTTPAPACDLTYEFTYDPDAQAFFTAVEGGGDTLTTTEKEATNQLVLDLKSASLFSVFDAFYPFVGGTSSSHKWNLLDPQDTDAAYRITWLGGMTHSSTGIKGNGSNSVGKTNWNPVSESVSNICMGLYINDGLTATPSSEYDMGGLAQPLGVNTDIMITLGFSNKTTKYVNFFRTNYFTTNAGDYSSCLLMGQNNGGTTQLFQDDLIVINSSQTLGTADVSFGIGASIRNIAGVESVAGSSQRGYGTAFIGDTFLTEPQVILLNTAIVTFNTSLSRN